MHYLKINCKPYHFWDNKTPCILAKCTLYVSLFILCYFQLQSLLFKFPLLQEKLFIIPDPTCKIKRLRPFSPAHRVGQLIICHAENNVSKFFTFFILQVRSARMIIFSCSKGNLNSKDCNCIQHSMKSDTLRAHFRVFAGFVNASIIRFRISLLVALSICSMVKGFHILQNLLQLRCLMTGQHNSLRYEK